MITGCFTPEFVASVLGGRQENTALLQGHFDYIFFTGSKEVGKVVLSSAAERLTPCTLELGGKSPCIVGKNANLKLAAKRIVFGKYLNCGQTCVAPDYLLCEQSVKNELLTHIKTEIIRQFGDKPLENPDYGRIVSQKHFDRVSSLITPEKTVFGGEKRPQTLQIAPTVLDKVDLNDKVMQQEIFGPVLPILTFNDSSEVFGIIEANPHPLALYLFSSDKAEIRRVMSGVSFGGGCINDVVIHLATSEMGFGGVGESGMGAYHGKCGFDTFSHLKSIVDKKTWLDLPMRYQPYGKLNEKLLRMFLR